MTTDTGKPDSTPRCSRCGKESTIPLTWCMTCLREIAAGARYVYLGVRDTDPALVGAPCDPVLNERGRCIVGRGNQLVRFADGQTRVVVRRRLRLRERAT